MKKLIWAGCLCLLFTQAIGAEPPPSPSFVRVAQQGESEVKTLILLSDVLIRLGNLRQNEQIFAAIETLCRSNAPQFLSLVQLLQAKTRLVGGQYLLARSQGDQMVAWAQEQKDPEELLEVYACLVFAGLRGGLTDVVKKYLPPFQAEVARASALSAPAWKFLSLSFQELDELNRNPGIPLAELSQRHDPAWQCLAALKEAPSRPVQERLVAELARLWLVEMCSGAREHPPAKKSPEEKRWEESLWLEANQLMRLPQIVRPGEMHDFELLPWCFHLVGFLTELHQQSLELGMLDDADQILTSMTDLEKTLVAQDASVLAAEKQIQTSLPANMLALLPKDFKLAITQGDLALTRLRLRQAQLRHLLVRSKGKLDQKKARKLAAECLVINERALGGVGYQGNEDARWLVLELLLTHRPPGWQKEAEPLLNQLREMNNRLGLREGKVRALTLTGELQAATGQTTGALASLTEATNTVEQYLQEVGASQAGGERIRHKYKRAYQLLTQLQLSQGQTDQAWQTLSRQQELEAASQNGQSLEAKAELSEVQRVRSDMAALEQQLAMDRSLGRDTSGTEQLLAKNKGEYQRVVADLRRTHPQYEAAMAVRPVEFLELKKSIPADTTAVLYFLGDDGLYLFVASRDNDLKIHKVPLQAKQLEQSVMRVRQLISSVPNDPGLRGFDWNSPAFQRHSQPLKQELSQLYKWLIQPLEGDLQQRPVLALVPGGILHYVPYPALCKLDGSGSPRFLAQDRQCVNLVKTSDLIPRGGDKKGQLLYALGNPDGSLPGAEREVKSIALSFPKSKQFVGKDATAARLRKLEPDTGYVHLATHGELSNTDPKNSYLVMAGAGEEGRFRATEIYDLDWTGVRLVTLSACKTALQEGNPGAAITNLAEAFRVAGGQSVVASLWSVADEPTEKLMVEFYKALAQGKSLAAALQQAENSLAKQPGLSHPYYWASFTLFGDWR